MVRAAISAICLVLVLARGGAAQGRNAGGNALDQGSDACPAAVIPMAPYYVEGTTVGMTNDYSATCGGGAQSPDVIYAFMPMQTDSYTVSLCGTSWDTVLHIRTGGECPGDSQVVCNDDYCGLASTVFCRLYAGHTYYIIVDGYSSGSSGPYGMYVLPHPACNFGSFHNFPAEVSEAPIDSDFHLHDPNGECGTDTLPAFPYYGTAGLLGRSFNYYDDTGGLRADEDWYSYYLWAPDTLQATLHAYFPIRMELLKVAGGCNSLQMLGERELTTCARDSIVIPCAAPGEYALHVTCTANTPMPIPQFYLLTVHHSFYPCECDTCECDSVAGLTVHLSGDQQHAWLHWPADSSGEVFTVYSTGSTSYSFHPAYWRSRAVHTAAAPGVQCWVDPEEVAGYQRYVVVRYCP